MDEKQSFKEMIRCIKGDVFRTTIGKGSGPILFSLLKCRLKYPWYTAIYYYRVCHYLRQWRLTKYTVYAFFKFLRWHAALKWGIDIPVDCRIGPGLRIAHHGSTAFSPGVIVGKNLTVAHGTFLGWVSKGPKMGTPISLGNNVFIGGGSKILGQITVGDRVVIGANSVVVKDVPSDVTVFGVPARVVAMEGSGPEDYCQNQV